jgi:pre-rRNA-processing protein TSR3
MLRQDDPFKCTAAKLAKFKLVEPVKYIHKSCLVLNPFSTIPLTRNDIELADSICAIDCSWEQTSKSSKNHKLFVHGIGRRLPVMLAANPINYAMPSKLSSAEALAGSLYILGEQELAVKIMDKFKWGHTFLELNFNLLKDYAQAKSISEVMQLEREYFSHLYRE